MLGGLAEAGQPRMCKGGAPSATTCAGTAGPDGPGRARRWRCRLAARGCAGRAPGAVERAAKAWTRLRCSGLVERTGGGPPALEGAAREGP
eukprot:9788634-Alexandrium_andersonii.AAC.1